MTTRSGKPGAEAGRPLLPGVSIGRRRPAGTQTTPLFEKEWHASGLALVAQIPRPRRLHGSAPGGGLPTRNHPVETHRGAPGHGPRTAAVRPDAGPGDLPAGAPTRIWRTRAPTRAGRDGRTPPRGRGSGRMYHTPPVWRFAAVRPTHRRQPGGDRRALDGPRRGDRGREDRRGTPRPAVSAPPSGHRPPGARPRGPHAGRDAPPARAGWRRRAVPSRRDLGRRSHHPR